MGPAASRPGSMRLTFLVEGHRRSGLLTKKDATELPHWAELAVRQGIARLQRYANGEDD